MSSFVPEKEFVIAEGSEGELYIYIKAKHDAPQHPVIIYDGKDHAVFVRNSEQKIILDYINPQVREKLRKAPMVVMVETILENIKDCYIAEVQKVDNLPVDWQKIGLTTWEEASINARPE